MDVNSIGHQQLNLPAQAPLMILPGVQLFPNVTLPLYIFEPRYRKMLSWSLEQDRVFCVAPMKPGISEARTTDDFYHVVGLGLVRACVGRNDGTSHLILQGLARVRIIGFLQDTPFRIAQIRELASIPAPASESERMIARLLEIATAQLTGDEKPPEAVERQLGQIDDPGTLADIVAHTCLADPEARQAVFEELEVARRVALLLSHFQD
jgi:Lon protease-like protein